MNLNVKFMISDIPTVLGALPVTLELTFASLFFAILLAVLFGVCILKKIPVLKQLVIGLNTFIKGVPLIDDDGQKLSNVGFDKESGSFWRIDWDYIPVHYPGTGDIFTSVLTASLLKGESLPIALNRATTFTEIAVKTTYSYGTEPRLGVLFEDCLSWLMTNTVLSDYRKL